MKIFSISFLCDFLLHKIVLIDNVGILILDDGKSIYWIYSYHCARLNSAFPPKSHRIGICDIAIQTIIAINKIDTYILLSPALTFDLNAFSSNGKNLRRTKM